MKVAVAFDHRGVALREAIMAALVAGLLYAFKRTGWF